MKELGAVVTDDGDDDEGEEDEDEEEEEEEEEEERSYGITKLHGRFLRKHIPCLRERTASSETRRPDIAPKPHSHSLFRFSPPCTDTHRTQTPHCPTNHPCN